MGLGKVAEIFGIYLDRSQLSDAPYVGEKILAYARHDLEGVRTILRDAERKAGGDPARLRALAAKLPRR